MKRKRKKTCTLFWIDDASYRINFVRNMRRITIYNRGRSFLLYNKKIGLLIAVAAVFFFAVFAAVDFFLRVGQDEDVV